jgi:hypothetical protein
MPDVDMPKVERPNMPSMPNLDFSRIDIGKAVAGAAAAVHIGRKAQRPRWPFAVGALIVAGLASWAILSNRAVRERLATGATAVRERIQLMLPAGDDSLDVEMDDPIAFNVAETSPIEPGPYSDATPGETAPYPDGLGNGRHTDEITAFEESGLPKIAN